MNRLVSRFSLVPFVAQDHSKGLAYSFSILLSLASVGVSQFFWSFSGDGKTHTMLPLAAVFISALNGGFGPGFFSCVLTTGLILFLLNPPLTFSIALPEDRIWLGIYLLLALGAAALAAILKSSIQMSKKASERLEREVKARTAELTSKNQELTRLLIEIEESRRFLDSLIDHIPIPVYLKDAEKLTITKANRAARENFKDVENLLGKTAYDVLPESIARRITNEDVECINKGKVVKHEETFLDPTLGKRIFFITKVPMYNRAGQASFVLATAEDVTEKRHAEEQRIHLVKEQAARESAERQKRDLEEAVRARDTFLSICSHELKTPLTSLKLQAGVIRMLFERSDFDALRSPKVRDLVLDADKEIDRINRLINDMLDVSRIRSGKLTLRPGEVDLSDVVREVVGHFRSIPPFKDVEITTDIPTHAVGFWDRNRIEQIVNNLISNALKYGGGKPVHVAIKTDENDAYLSVKDNGVGISHEDQSRIFQRFERASASQSISGLGLGLYIVKEIVTMHGGDIQVESDIGRGSRFTVRLPILTVATSKAA